MRRFLTGRRNRCAVQREAKFYDKLPNKKIKCKLCPRECVIDDRERGYCGVRENRGGIYYTLVHSRVVAAHVDPDREETVLPFPPRHHGVLARHRRLQRELQNVPNWDISQARPEQVNGNYLPPQSVAEVARQYQCTSVAYTYSEPVIYYEYMTDTAERARAAGIRNVVVTGGYIQPEPLKLLCGKVDAIKVDLKAYSEKFYREVVNGELKPVLNALVQMRKLGMWTEIVYLVVPTLNDGEREFTGLARWVKSNLGPDVPVHFSRFHPEYLLKNLPVTPVSTLDRAHAIAVAEGLHYVYVGNVPGHAAGNTYCPKCRRAVVERTGFAVRATHLSKGNCKFCRQPIAGVWEG